MRGTAKAMKYERVATAVASGPAVPACTTSVYFEHGRAPTPAYKSTELAHGHVITGPAIIIDPIGTIVLEPACTLTVTPYGDFCIEVALGPAHPTATEPPASVSLPQVSVCPCMCSN